MFSGRWTQEEHELFLHGLKLYNRQWKQIADIIKTRTVVQIRTHAQKYFQKLNKCNKVSGTVASDTDIADFGQVVKMKTLPNTPKSGKEKPSKKSLTICSNALKLEVKCNNINTLQESPNSVEKFANDLSEFEWLASSLATNGERQEISLNISSDMNNKASSDRDLLINDDYIDFSWLVENDFSSSNNYIANSTPMGGKFDTTSNDSSSGTSEESLSNSSEDDLSHQFDMDMFFFNSTLPITNEDIFSSDRKRSFSCSVFDEKKRGRPIKFKRQLNDIAADDFDIKESRFFETSVNGTEDEFNAFGLMDL